MRLRLNLPSDWQPQAWGDQTVVIAPGGATPEVILAYVPLLPFPADGAAWIQQSMLVDCGPQHRMEAQPAVAETTHTGWPYKRVVARIFQREPEGAGETLFEDRLGAFYRFLEYGCVVLLRSRNPERFADLSQTLETILRSARPDFSGDGEVTCLAGIYTSSPLPGASRSGSPVLPSSTRP